MPALKRLLNQSEDATDQRLRAASRRHDASVFPKVRLADILPIEGSGITNREYSYALNAHVDFVVADADHDPLFAVEFDGPTHRSEKQMVRDEIKNRLCRRLGLPLIRIDELSSTRDT
jgi:very-short-patch-repair endonuclease